MPPLPGCISRFVLQADHPVVGLHVRHMSNNNMNICAIFMLKPEYQKISLYHTSELCFSCTLTGLLESDEQVPLTSEKPKYQNRSSTI